VLSPSIQFVASLIDANRALNTLRYLAPGEAGEDEITISIDDNGYSGRGGALTGSSVIPVRIVNDNTANDDGDPSLSHDEFFNGSLDSERDWDETTAPPPDADGNGLADGNYEPNTGGEENDLESGGSLTQFYPAGSVSWKDVNAKYEARQEESPSQRMGNGDDWDN
jgi:hypothetical protein